jgi:hypothetical protein
MTGCKPNYSVGAGPSRKFYRRRRGWLVVNEAISLVGKGRQENNSGMPPRQTRQAQGGLQASKGQAGDHAQPEAQLRLPATLERNRPGGGLRADGPLKPDDHVNDLRPLDPERKVPRPRETRQRHHGSGGRSFRRGPHPKRLITV